MREAVHKPRRFVLVPCHMLLIAAVAAAAQAGIHKNLYYSRYDHAPGEANVKTASFSWDGTTLTVSEQRDLRELPGADGLAFAPDGDLVIGGQEPYVYKFDINQK